LGGSVKGLVPELVEQNLRGKLDPAYRLAEFRASRDERSEGRKSRARKKA